MVVGYILAVAVPIFLGFSGLFIVQAIELDYLRRRVKRLEREHGY